mmetsp:Transcript_16807/g.25235  ORF Transcript_16807/g.25235 Transcript_16807/m.25235 type:complete len:462 (+) Transcript_16807:117-1502(+)
MLPMYNPSRRFATQPINIGHSPDRYNHNHGGVRIASSNTNPDGDDSSFDEDDLHQREAHGNGNGHGNGHGHGHINMKSVSNLSSSFANVTVGSLPSSRRERRYMVSHGNNERLGVSAGVGVGGINVTSTGKNTNDLSRSMPVPHAPFFSSKRDLNSRARLSRIPSMQLPESVTDVSEASSMPYGSLNESQFRLPSSANSNPGSIPYANSNASGDNGNGNVASSYNPSAGVGLDIQKKVQEMRKTGSLIKNDQGGLASLFGGDVDQGKDENEDEDRQEIANGSDKDSHSQMSGIGSLIEHSTLTQRMQNESQPRNGVPVPIVSHFGMQQPQLEQSQSYSHSHIIQSGIANPCESQLSGSLTGLSILKCSPKGMVDLEPAQREAMASMRSKSYSEDVSAFLQPTLEGVAARPDTLTTSTATPYGVMDKDLRPVRRFSNGSDHSLLQGQGNGDEDIDDLFNLDM